jgi:hypothetical protein
MDRPDCEIPAHETLFAAALYLATNYARTGCPLLCRMMMRQLACIQHHPDESVPQSLRETCRKLREEWERIGIERAQALHEAAVRKGEGVLMLH